MQEDPLRSGLHRAGSLHSGMRGAEASTHRRYFHFASSWVARVTALRGVESALKSTFNVFPSCFCRSDFVTLPFQGAEVLLDSVMPLSGNRWGSLAGGWGAVVESKSSSLRAWKKT